MSLLTQMIARSTIQNDLNLFTNHSLFFGCISTILFVLAVISVFNRKLKLTISLGICLILALCLTGLDDPNDGPTPQSEHNIIKYERDIPQEKMHLKFYKLERHLHAGSKKDYDPKIIKYHGLIDYHNWYIKSHMSQVHAPIFHHKLF